MNHRSRGLARWGFSLAALLLTGVLLAGCGPGAAEEDSGANYDRPGSQAKVSEGVTLLETTMDAYIGNPDPNTPFPYPDLTGIEGIFEDAVVLDPTYDDAGFWAAVFELPRFLQSASTQAFLAKLGWQDLTTPTDTGYEFDDFADRFGQTYNETLGTPDPLAPPMNPFYLPTDPELEDGQLPSYNPVILGGTDDYVDVRFDELHAFVTKNMAGSARSAVNRLKNVSSDFETSLTLTDTTNQQSVTLSIDRFEAKVIQAFYGALELVTTIFDIWTFPNLDEFISDRSTRDPLTGAFVDPGTGIDDISNADLIGYFRNGHNGGGLPLSANPAGITRVKQALADLLEAVQSAFTYLVETADMSGHLFDLDLVFGTYTDEPAVIRYSLKAGAGIAGDALAALTQPGGRMVNIYQPVAFIQNFATCTPGGTSTAGTGPGNVPGLNLPPDPATLTLGTITLGGSGLSGPVHEISHTITVNDAYNGDGTAHYFQVTLNTLMNVSITTTDVNFGDNLDTSGAVGYLQDGGGTPAITEWDADMDSGVGTHFGLSIDADNFNPGDMPGLITPITLIIRVDAPAGSEFKLNLTVADDASWPNDLNGNPKPIFLKGGVGRTFRMETWAMGGVNVNLAAAVDLVGKVWDLSIRDSLDFIPNATTGGSDPYLEFLPSVLRSEISKVFPQANFTGSAIDPVGGNAPVNVFALPLDFTIPGVNPVNAGVKANPVQFPDYPGTFCANPADLGVALDPAGGFSPLF